MAELYADMSISLDGFVAGPDPTLEDPLGRGGMDLHAWAFATRTFRRMHGQEGGGSGVDDDLAMASLSQAGATIMGRRMFSGGEGDWESDPRASGWWGDDPPFHHPVFVLTHHERDPLPMQGGTSFTFVTGGIEAALEQARDAAGKRDVAVGGGADAVQQYLAAGLLDRIRLHVAPLFLGSGRRLFDGVEAGRLEPAGQAGSLGGVAHLDYRVLR